MLGDGPGRDASVKDARSVKTQGGEVKVSLNVRSVPLADALQSIARQTGVKLTYPTSDVLNKRVTVKFDSLPVSRALTETLRGTGLQIDVVTANHIAITAGRSSATSTDSLTYGTISGRVTDSASGKGIAGVNVSVVGTQLKTLTRDNGTYVLTKVVTGEQSLQFKMLGYATTTKKAQVTDGQTVQANVVMKQAASTLTSVVTTATGIQRSLEVGSDVTRISVDEVRKYSDVNTVVDVIATRVPGLFTQSLGGDAGAGSRLRIRGIHSVTLSNDPIVIIDGVRMASIGAEGGLSSRLNDIDPASIETIEVFKGASAATLYGPDASNGVIVITKKRGLVGQTRWTVNANSQTSGVPRKFPGQTLVWGHSVESNDPMPCTDERGCVGRDSVSDYSLLNDDRTTTIGRGRNNNYGLSMRTGSNTAQTALSVRILDQLGTTKLSDVGVERLEKLKGMPVPSYARRPNALQQVNGDANITTQTIPFMDVAFQVGIMHQTLRSSGNEIYNGMNQDSLSYRPEKVFLRRRQEGMDQYNSTLTLNTRQLEMINWSGTFGVRNGKGKNDAWLRPEDCLALDCSNAKGSRTTADVSTSSYTVNTWLGMNNSLSSLVKLRSTAGLNMFRNKLERYSVSGGNMPMGMSDPSRAPSMSLITNVSENATAGAYLEERLSIGDRLFMSGAIRRDVGSALGTAAKTPTFPKFDLSWIASQRPIDIPVIGTLNTVRLRTSHGQSGYQPTLSVLKAQLSRGTTFFEGSTHTTYIYDGLGNSMVTPERTSEMEFGVDFNLSGRIEELSVTYFRHLTRDAIVSRPVSTEGGLPNTSRMENLGKVQNTGFEASTSLRLLDTRAITWNLGAALSHTGNKVLSLGQYTELPSGGGDRQQQRVAVGYPLFGVWAPRLLAAEDRNGDGILAWDEVVISDSMTYTGWSQPKYTMTYHTSVGILGGYLRISTSLSHLSGLTKQAATIAKTGNAVGDVEGQLYTKTGHRGLQTISSLAWNSADVSAQLPSKLLRQVRAQSGTFSVTGSNLHQWTNYRGADPLVGPLSDNSNDDRGTTPNTRNWTLRFSLTY